jgi:glycosyltransferase involved in cell wall biosynthesis
VGEQTEILPSAGCSLPALPVEPLVSVVLPTFNAPDYTADAVHSVRQSTYAKWKCIVVDDGSTDDTLDRAKAAAANDPRFLFTIQENAGQIAAINLAARCVEGEIVALLDNDDVFLPTKIERVVATLRQKPRAGLLTHRMYVSDERLSVLGVMPLTNRLLDGDVRSQLQRNTSGDPRFGVTSAMALRRSIFDRLFPADPAIRFFPDELIRRIAPLLAEVACCDEPLGIRRTHRQNHTNATEDGLAAFVKATLATYRLIARSQREVASSIDIDLPAADLDLDLMETILARLQGREDAARRRANVLASPQFAQLPAGRQLYWRISLSVPRPALSAMVRQLYAPSSLKLLLHWFWMRRLRRTGVIPAVGPSPELPAWDVARWALSSAVSRQRVAH